ncbi:N-carbamoylputrescine amidase [Raphidocelis subcapitata]|uniref:N-carbamoylputrescine amidase n=1 Tax=Raphidocelis subcapitata TaxID=307507 RepID=A0A2V0PJ70_9CHLO|nr:N-carbamoylputrescine amidase [Raphidocelis subcapitata]|eukprot:GBF99848.1 N-carbamoylputrescine amidase [Raphidocelis subcapitata]
MVRLVKVAATQMKISRDPAANLAKAEKMVRSAAAAGAQVILLQELFENVYFCQEQKPEYFEWAKPLEESEPVQRMSKLAKELGVVLPVSFFESVNSAHFNSLAMIDADGTVLGVYRKSHIPDGPGYQEKFYFSPGDTGFKVWDTKFGRMGAGICWDQWFPECARSMALMGAEILFYPTAIGSEPQDSSLNSYPHWVRTMLGHAAANLTPVVASNRIGTEEFAKSSITFYGGAFISGSHGEILEQVGADPKAIAGGNLDPAPKREEGFVVREFDLEALRLERLGWGIFRDRRPELYRPIVTYDGSRTHSANA